MIFTLLLACGVVILREGQLPHGASEAECVCVCVCVRERERERESVCVCVYAGRAPLRVLARLLRTANTFPRRETNCLEISGLPDAPSRIVSSAACSMFARSCAVCGWVSVRVTACVTACVTVCACDSGCMCVRAHTHIRAPACAA